jgi:serine/threonine protein kinase
MPHCPNPDCARPYLVGSCFYCQGCGNLLTTLRGRYQALRPLGQGGFGKTFLAQDKDRLQQWCVIKQFAPVLQGQPAFAMAKSLFEQEAQQLQKLGEHPQIPALYAYFEENQQLYLIQQYIPGQTLEEELHQQGPFSEIKILALLREILDILDFIHCQGVIHRDIKPSNIIRSQIPSHPPSSLFLIDFGIAKQIAGTVLPAAGTMVGSHGYAPREQMEEGRTSPASDLYGLGATCFYLLTGKDPTHLSRQEGYRWTAHWQDHLSFPLSAPLTRILDKLLAEQAVERWPSAQAVLAQLPPATTVQGTSGVKTISLKGSISKTRRQSSGPDWLPFMGTFMLGVAGVVSLLLLGRLALSPALSLCQVFNNCPVDSIAEHLQQVYKQAKTQANGAIKTTSTPTISLAKLKQNYNALNKAIIMLENLPQDSPAMPNLRQDLELYRANLNLLSGLIRQKEALASRSPSPTPRPSVMTPPRPSSPKPTPTQSRGKGNSSSSKGNTSPTSPTPPTPRRTMITTRTPVPTASTTKPLGKDKNNALPPLW